MIYRLPNCPGTGWKCFFILPAFSGSTCQKMIAQPAVSVSFSRCTRAKVLHSLHRLLLTVPPVEIETFYSIQYIIVLKGMSILKYNSPYYARVWQHFNEPAVVVIHHNSKKRKKNSVIAAGSDKILLTEAVVRDIKILLKRFKSNRSQYEKQGGFQ